MFFVVYIYFPIFEYLNKGTHTPSLQINRRKERAKVSTVVCSLLACIKKGHFE